MGRKDFDGLSVVTDKKTAMTLAAMWVNEEHLAFMVKSRPPFRVVNEPMYQYMVKHGWVIPFGTLTMAKTRTSAPNSLGPGQP